MATSGLSCPAQLAGNAAPDELGKTADLRDSFVVFELVEGLPAREL
jgi:hypothetical protein